MDQKVIDVLQRAYDPGQDKKVEDRPVNPGFFWKVIHLDPVLWRGAIVAVIGLLASFGLVLSDDKTNAIFMAVVAISAIVQAVWTRDAVTPNEKVVVYKPDPIEQPNAVAPGGSVSSNIVAVANAAASSSGSVVPWNRLPFPSEATDWQEDWEV